MDKVEAPKKEPARIGCYGGCKVTVADADEATQLGWELLQITSNRWRCGTCTRELREASKLGSTSNAR